MTNRAMSVVVLLSLLVAACAAEGQQPKPDAKVNPDAKTLQDFQARIEQYQDLHKSAAKKGPRLKETEEPAKITAAQDAIASNIRAARKDARAGDIFTPEIRQLFRRLMYPELKGAEGAETKETIKEDAPSAVRLVVNAKYPEEQPLPTVPPNLLASLPKLPENLEYRIVGKTLILRDVDANLIVDFIPNAIR
jgi:hypothetical protein